MLVVCEAGLLGAGTGQGSCAAPPYRADNIDWNNGCPSYAEVNIHTMKNRLNEKTDNDIIKLSDQCINLNFCSVALSMDTVTPWQTGREQPTSEIAMELAMEWAPLWG